MRYKLILLLLFTTQISLAQKAKPSAYLNTFEKFLSVIKKIDSVITSINDHENLRKLNRLLGNINVDIMSINNQKFKLANDIYYSKNLNDPTEIEILIYEIKNIHDQIEKFDDSYDEIKSLLNETNIEINTDDFDDTFMQQKGYLLEDIQNKLERKKINKTDIINEAKQAKVLSESVHIKVLNLRNKIIRLLKKNK